MRVLIPILAMTLTVAIAQNRTFGDAGAKAAIDAKSRRIYDAEGKREFRMIRANLLGIPHAIGTELIATWAAVVFERRGCAPSCTPNSPGEDFKNNRLFLFEQLREELERALPVIEMDTLRTWANHPTQVYFNICWPGAAMMRRPAPYKSAFSETWGGRHGRSVPDR